MLRLDHIALPTLPINHRDYQYITPAILTAALTAAPVPIHIGAVPPPPPYAALVLALRNLWPPGYQPLLDLDGTRGKQKAPDTVSPALDDLFLSGHPDLDPYLALQEPPLSPPYQPPDDFLAPPVFHSGFSYTWVRDEDTGLPHALSANQDATWDGTGTIDPSLLCAAPTPSPSASPPLPQDDEPSHPPSHAQDMPHLGELDLSDSDDDYVSQDTKPAPTPHKLVAPPADTDPDLTFCHHCRRTTAYDKMRCTLRRPTGEPCGKRYCTLCIAKRYPAIVFEAYYRTFACPACLGTCNCSICSRKRGEVYFGERTGGLPKPAKATRASPVDPGRAKTYRATIYGLSGAKVGTAFVDADGHDDVVMARPAKPARARSTAHVFVGQIPEHWGLKKSARVRDLDPLPARTRTATARAYIGKKPRARRPQHSQPERPSSPFSSESLTPLPSDDGAGDLGGTPVSLGELDVEYAIRAALAQVSLGGCA